MEESELCFPQLLNSSCVKFRRPHFEATLTYTLLFFISLFTAFLNLLVIVSISHFKQLHTPTNLLLLSLAVSDFFIGLLLFFQSSIEDGCWILGDLMCTLYQYLAAIVTGVSVETMVLISVDRYVAICDPLHYNTKITNKTIKICVGMCWVGSTIYSTAALREVLIHPAFLNLLVIVSISHFKQLHTPTNLLLLSLAVSDFFIGLLLFFQIMLIDGCWFLGDLMCSLYQYLDYVITSTSVGAMVLISIDRYVAICDPLRYSTKVTQSRVKFSVCVCWISSVIFQSLILQDVLKQPGRFNSCVGECVIVINYAAGLADVVFSFALPITVIILLYLRVFVVAVSQARALRSHTAPVSLQGSTKAPAIKSELKAARTLGVVVVVFLMCLCPYYCVALTGQDNVMNASSAAFVICLYYFNACLNPVIYTLFYPWFRKSIKLILALKILQPDSCEANVL